MSGPILDRFGTRAVLAIASALVAVGLVGISVAHSFSAAAGPCVLLGLGGGGLNVSSNVLVSDLHGDDRGPMMNVLGIFLAIGALFMPLLAATALLTISQLLLAAASLAALCVLAYTALRFPPPREAQGFSWRGVSEVVRAPGMLLFGSLLFCESGNESSIGGWVSTYLGRMGSKPRTATWILAGYWMALMLGRIVASRLLRRIEKSRLVLISGLGSTAAAALLLMAPCVAMMAAATALIGFSFAPIYRPRWRWLVTATHASREPFSECSSRSL
ncbi:MAG TPA: MFS transporter [Terriglobia bacterium]|nr:MFS transporter [Terriglobia bacterium]